MSGQCLECGRVDPDWSDPSSKIQSHGFKANQRPKTEDRTTRYREWRRTFGDGAYVSDVDQVEFRVIGGIVTPIAILEISRVDGNHPVPIKYLQSAWTRFSERDPQKEVIETMARSTGIPAYFVLYRWDLTEFWTRLFYPDAPLNRWKHTDQPGYSRWVRELG